MFWKDNLTAFEQDTELVGALGLPSKTHIFRNQLKEGIFNHQLLQDLSGIALLQGLTGFTGFGVQLLHARTAMVRS